MFCLANRVTNVGLARSHSETALANYARANFNMEEITILRASDLGFEYLTKPVFEEVSGTKGIKLDERNGKEYPTVKMPDGKWWLAEDLFWNGASRFTFLELPPAIIPGCRIPQKEPISGYSDFENLISSIPGSYDNAGYHLKANNSWTVNGVDTYGFNAKNVGRSERPFNQPGPWFEYPGNPPPCGILYMEEWVGIQSIRTLFIQDDLNAVSTGGSYSIWQDQYGGGIRNPVRLIVETGNVFVSQVYIKHEV